MSSCPCFFSGPKLLDYTYHPNLEHKCKKDILIGRVKNSEDKLWKKIRPRPTKTQYVGPYYICKGKEPNFGTDACHLLQEAGRYLVALSSLAHSWSWLKVQFKILVMALEAHLSYVHPLEWPACHWPEPGPFPLWLQLYERGSLKGCGALPGDPKACLFARVGGGLLNGRRL